MQLPAAVPRDSWRDGRQAWQSKSTFAGEGYSLVAYTWKCVDVREAEGLNFIIVALAGIPCMPLASWMILLSEC